MSKVFSVIGLETNTGIRDVGLMGGIPEVADIQNSQLYKEMVEDCGESELITVAVKSFRYGEGEPEDAKAEDLDWLKAHPEFLKSGSGHSSADQQLRNPLSRVALHARFPRS